MQLKMRVMTKQGVQAGPGQAQLVQVTCVPVDPNAGPSNVTFSIPVAEQDKYPIWAEVAVSVPEAN